MNNSTLKRIQINPGKCSGNVVIPTSKSICHRAIICASLANGRSVINNVYFSKDIMVTIHAMESLGAEIIVEGNKLFIQGIKDFNHVKYTEINVFESASTLRFLIPILSLFNYEFIIRGEKSLFSRPLEIYEELYLANNCVFERNDDFIRIKGHFTRKTFQIEGNISSQFVSGLLFMLPLLNFDTTLIVNHLESKNYIYLTLDTMKNFGVTIPYGKTFTIHGKQQYLPNEYTIEGDYTQLANFLVLGTINNDISVSGLNLDTLQGDASLTMALPNVKFCDDGYKIFKATYNDFNFDITDTPDLGPILMVLLTQTGGVIKNVQRLKYKESNRCEAMINELKKFDIDIMLINNNLYIKKKNVIETDKLLDSHNDHRIFMALAVLSTICTTPTRILNYECVEKSYPTFIDDLVTLGISIQKE